jgi:hypothetical protein
MRQCIGCREPGTIKLKTWLPDGWLNSIVISCELLRLRESAVFWW